MQLAPAAGAFYFNFLSAQLYSSVGFFLFLGKHLLYYIYLSNRAHIEFSVSSSRPLLSQ